MAIFFIAAIGLLLLFLFLQRLSQANTRVLSDVLKGTSATLLVIAFVLFILSGRVLYATLLLGLIALLLSSHRSYWKKKPSLKPLQLQRPFTVQEACAALGLAASAPLSLSRIEKAYQKKMAKLADLMPGVDDKERENLKRAKDFLILFVQDASSPPPDFL